MINSYRTKGQGLRDSDQTRLLSGEKWVTARFCEKDILSSALRVIQVGEHR
ncbi:hypothetical protein [Streptomyces sp. NPDC001492]